MRDDLRLFAHEVIKEVAVQTHTDFSFYLNPVLEKYIKIFENKYKLNK